IQPTALDVAAPDSWRPPPPRKKNGLPIVLAVMGLCGTLAAVAGVVGVHKWQERKKEDAEYAQKIAEENRRHLAGTNPVMDPQPAPTVDPPPVVIVTPVPTVPTVDLPKAKPKPVVVTAPPVITKPVGVKTTPASTGTGTVKTYNAAAGKAIFVDGKQAGV